MAALYTQVHARYGDPKAFMDMVREALEKWGISQARLARRAGTSDTHASRWFTGRTAPTMESMVLLDEALDELVGEAQEREALGVEA